MDKKNQKERWVKKRKRGEEALRVSEAHRHQETILEWAHDAIISVDREGRIIEFSKVAETMFGYAREAVIGREMAPLIIPPALRERHRAGWERHLATGATAIIGKRIEITAMRADGTEFPVELTVTRFGPDGNPTFTAFIRDITERKETAAREAARLRKMRQLSALGMQLSGDPATVFEHVVRMIGELFEVRVVCLSEIVGGELLFKAVYRNGQIFRDVGRCPLDIAPCATVEKTKDIRVFDRVMERFPKASFLRDHNAFTYCGFPSIDGQGRVIAVTCLLDDKPHEFSDEDQEILRLIGQRIAAEVERGRNIIERQRAEKDLRESEARLRSIFFSGMIGILFFDLAGSITDANDTFLRIVGYTREDLLAGKVRWDAMTPPEFRDADIHGVEELIATGVCMPFEKEYIRKDGSRVPILLGATFVEGFRDRGAAFVLDITERKQVEAALRESEKRFRSLYNDNPSMYFTVDADGIVLSVNRFGMEQLGYRADELVGRSVWAVFHEGDRQKALECLRVAFQAPAQVHQWELRKVRKDGCVLWVREDVRIIQDAAGKPLALVVCEDITERKQAEEMLRENQRVSSTLICNLPGMVYRCRNDRDRTVTYLSEGCFALTGYHQSDFTENRITYVQLLHPDDQDIVRDGVQAALRAKKPFTFTYRIKTASGEEKWVWEQGRGVFARDGGDEELLFLEGFITDITKHMQVETALQESERRSTMLSHRLLEVQEAERRHVARELHDEIGQCLTGLKLGLETALRLRERESRMALLQLIEQADSLISKSRELSLDLRPAMLDDKGLLPALLFHFERLRERFGLQVRFGHRGIEGRFHSCLETAVFRIVQEALTNVVRHARVEEAMVTIITNEDGLNVHVKDEGVGFAPDKIIASGKGAGLSGIYERTILLGGHCDVESAPGTGTQIKVWFPFLEVAKREAISRAEMEKHD